MDERSARYFVVWINSPFQRGLGGFYSNHPGLSATPPQHGGEFSGLIPPFLKGVRGILI